MNSGAKKILYLNKVGEIGGAEVSLQALVENLPRPDFEPVVVLGNSGALYNRLKAMKISVYVYPLECLRTSNPVPFIKTVRFLKHVIAREKVSLIHTNTNWDNQYGVIAAGLTGIPHILHVRGFSKGQHSWKSFYNLGSMAICNSEHTRQQFTAFSGFKKRVEVVYNGIDSGIFRPDYEKRMRMRRRYGFKDTDIVMGMAGRLTKEKGQVPLLEALVGRFKKNKNYKVLIAGDTVLDSEGGYKKQINAFVMENKLDEQVILTGFMDDMPSFYNALDLFLHPAFREPFGRVVAEAMAVEKPVIASKIGGVPEIISANSEDGVLVDCGDWETWRERSEFLISHSEEAVLMGRQGREKVIKRFSLAAQTDILKEIYKSLVG